MHKPGWLSIFVLVVGLRKPFLSMVHLSFFEPGLLRVVIDVMEAAIKKNLSLKTLVPDV